jgi:hypothetical protein
VTRSAPLRIDCDHQFEDVLDVVRAGMRAIARPGPADGAGSELPAELLGWCDDESDEGLSQVERATACRKLQCSAVELVEAHVHCAGDAGGIGGGVVKAFAWIPKQEG